MINYNYCRNIQYNRLDQYSMLYDVCKIKRAMYLFEDYVKCASSPCQHGGTCSSRAHSYSCKCRPNFSGTNCESKPILLSSLFSALCRLRVVWVGKCFRLVFPYLPLLQCLLSVGYIIVSQYGVTLTTCRDVVYVSEATNVLALIKIMLLFALNLKQMILRDNIMKN